ncbi:L-threonylcarbamoyladenylate synthase [Bryobacter aggregatus]|uniref:L-threonylcarbamoyladenylate synthase n=1 Tax=Bryobacter aggregatus TaxID=360054 RepID=UPI001EE23EBB|nr:L-threonylcarbamoyladenylate synthase [Bryobacter aggregatus]
MARTSFQTKGNEDRMLQAAELLRRGGVVAFPTETVYGLGANALDPAAIARIYEIKGRPRTSPLIVHVATIEKARELVTEWPETAERLARRFWPGPLTLVLPKHEVVPVELTAGLGTVGIRIPAHPVALRLLELAGVPVAAPSANRFMQLSPTTAAHVEAALGAAVDLILDGGATRVGIESTVLSLVGGVPLLLRPGMISRVQIEEVIGPVEVAGAMEGAHPSPGMQDRHYSPRTPLYLVRGPADLAAAGRGVYLFLTRPALGVTCVAMPAEAEAYAAQLYETLHRYDDGSWDWIAVEQPSEEPAWAGVNDRLRRARMQ